MDNKQIKTFINATWDESILPTLSEYIAIPNKSPMFDADWEQHGYMEQALQLAHDWCEQHAVNDMKMDILRLPHRTPLLFIEVPGQVDDTILLYGHLDKQPEMVGWDEDKSPWKPVIKDNKLYGRGGADDGYAVFSALTAIKALQLQNIPHARCVIIIECCEESGSYDLPEYLTLLNDRIGEPSLVIGLDSGCGNYDQLWSTTSLRGVITGNLSIDILTEGVHSGLASGIAPSSFRILRQLLSRVEDENSGEILLSECQAEIPQQRIEQAQLASEILGDDIPNSLPFVKGAKAMNADNTELLLNRTWRATLSVTGVDGIPAIPQAGNVLRPQTTVKLSFRVAPTADAGQATEAIKACLENNPPYGAKVTFKPDAYGNGWHAPELADWLAHASDEASTIYYGNHCGYFGEGGSIPFMGMLGKQFPKAQFLITGVLGPHSNAHGPNEFLHIPMVKKLTCCVAHIIAKHAGKSA